jgi:hypothetical protein
VKATPTNASASRWESGSVTSAVRLPRSFRRDGVLTAEIVARGRRALGGRQRNGRGAGHQFDVLSLDVGPFAAGAAAAAAMLAARANDGRNGPFDLPIGSEPGVWRPTPPTFAFDPAP